MAFVVATVLVVAGCGQRTWTPEEAHAEVRSVIVEVVPDEPRQSAVLEHVDRIQAILTEQRTGLIELRDELRALGRDYDATHEDFQRVRAAAQERRRALRTAILEEMVAMRADVTPEEWSRIADVQTRVIASHIAAIEEDLEGD